ncbi:MAG: ABC transporter ATP-binding protein [Pigeon pea little leaf phytoplasma]|uniref:ABC transporter ATP-binding protein/permease n=1 Tax=Candidatus Phytoplasma fabacearum TaxID=2982628 RepID=A0ABU8ZT53_9MOLU|nr:ABC transporter ATP-binding protein ['Bituminaria bituminosa' little leaf phytoplasma]MDV3153959.1 ABC transporter ATP-binding protein [Pigeon pea little leaf phytoplasma]MDO7983588.1 ABC transporter ATP-binding protein/permease ['Bituminaria bituminosa' little leaf phytoplasma]MDO8023743.1 ABC transporter ATP-binding protein/permease ['Bituminaria bituminosa' little leaf phytoplasma]MDO8030438.1 ABC transporter ATP-binding protein/permease ['Bituminaria bituminosa' little leaf phytoplasma]
MKKIFYFLKPFRKEILVSIFLIFVVAAIDAFIVIFEGNIIINFIQNNFNNNSKIIYSDNIILNFLRTKVLSSFRIISEYMSYIILLLFINLFLYLLCIVARFIYNKLIIVIIHKSIQNIRQRVYQKMLRLPISYFENNTIGNIMSIVINDLETVSNGLQQSCVAFVLSCFSIIMIIFIMFWANLRFAVLICLMIPSSLFVIWLINKKARSVFIQRFEKTGEYLGFLQEKYTGHKEIILYNQQLNNISDFQNLNKQLASTIFKSNWISGLVMPIINSFTYIVMTLIVILGYFLLNYQDAEMPYLLFKLGFGTIQLGLFQSFIKYIWRLGNPLRDLSQMFVILQSTSSAANRVFNFLAENEELDIKNNLIIPSSVQGYIKFSHVTFQYQPDQPILRDISFEINKHKMVAIVGPTGSGKTSLVNLLVRFYDVSAGTITIDGVDISTIQKSALRKMIGIVVQDSWLFHGTIMDNIRYGNFTATEEQVIQAAKQVNVHDFIMTKQNGYNTIINEELDNISQGEKQLITIARTFLNNPSIVILDEATASVDTQIEIIFQQSMQKLLKDKTSFVIAHRLSTIVNADIILVLQNGLLVEKGSHKELLSKQGFYYNLYNSQFK